MVRDGAQLYTMEGIAAGLIMLITAYLVLGSTSVYTPGDTHLTDMQLEQVGSDILKVMDTPRCLTASLEANRTDLELIVNTTDSAGFYQKFREEYLYNAAVPPVATATTVGSMGIQINATIWYRSYDNTLGNYTIAASTSPVLAASGAKAPGVRVTRWILTSGRPNRNQFGLFPIPQADYDRIRREPQEMLVEVLMWKV